MRVMLSDLEPGAQIPDDGLPRYRNRPGSFMFKLLTTWASMGFRSPRVAGVAD